MTVKDCTTCTHVLERTQGDGSKAYFCGYDPPKAFVIATPTGLTNFTALPSVGPFIKCRFYEFALPVVTGLPLAIPPNGRRTT